jgi:aldose 1-epimerase
MTWPGAVTLRHGDWQAQLIPAAGGLIAALDHAGQAVLRPMAQRANDPLDAACFPMVPWCNRIARGRFIWADKAMALAPNFAPEPHAIHGHGWQSRWEVESLATDRCVMVHRHDGAAPGWPWAYAAHQEVVLSKQACTIILSLTNLSGRLMPAGLGLHPYLRRRPQSRVRFTASHVLDVGEDMIPTGQHRAPADFADFMGDEGAALPPEPIDHCYAGWDGQASLHDDLGTITLRAAGAGALHLYAPRDDAVLCLEPVNHLPNAANAAAMPLCAPGETLSLTLAIGTAPCAPE